MNCLQFRRAIELAPNDIGDEERLHLQQCASCSAHARRVAAFDAKLSAAIKIPAPENLSERILLRHAFRTRKARTLHWPALAAGVTLLISGALTVMSYLHNESQLEREVLALVDAADYALQAREPIAMHTLSNALEPVGLTIDGLIGRVSFAGRCLVRGNLSGHVVLRAQDSSDSPITVFLMPAERLVRESRFEGKNWSGLLIPAANGAIAIVAPRGQALSNVTRRVLEAVRWPA